MACSEPLNSSSSSPVTGARVLLVEDVRLNQEVAIGLLSNIGAVVDLAVNGAEAVIKATQNSYDIVLMDIQMPVMDGVMATYEIRKQVNSSPRLPIVAMTANSTLKDRQVCFDAGMDDYITKPIDPDHLYKILYKWVPDAAQLLAKGSQESVELPVSDYPVTISGLNIQDGLRRILGNKNLYFKMLNEFAKTRQFVVQDIQHLIESGDWDEARNLAHATKGVAGTIGAVDVERCAGEIEFAIVKVRPLAEVIQLLSLLESHLNALFVEIGKLEPSGSSINNNQAVDLSQIGPVCARLISLLQDGDSAAYDEFGQHEDLISSAFPNFFTAIKQSILSFDFATALAELNKANVTLQSKK